jgi:4'-phosphopantetheinyl transferase EntD
VNERTLADSDATTSVEQALIRGLFPEGFAVASGPVRDNAFLFPDEAAAVGTSIDSRKQDFSNGRAYARAALDVLGISSCVIPSQPDRSPRWPDGVVGSITHSHGLVAAVVGWQRDFAGVGLDVESLERTLAKGIDRLIRTPAEQEHMKGQQFPAGIDPVRLVFSAKESIHKCVAPQSGITLGFHDVELDLDLEQRSFRARLRRVDTRLPDFRKLEGRFAYTARFVITAAWMTG